MIGEMPSTRSKLTILKVKGGMRVEVVLLSAEPLGFNVHWLGTRSYMCPGVDCPACFAAVGSRWAGMQPVRWFNEKHRDGYVGVLEFTGGTYERLAGLQKMLGLQTLLGVPCRVTRSRDRAVLRVEPTIEDQDGVRDVKAFPQWLLLDAMATLYGLPSCPDGLAKSEWETLAVPRAAQMIRVALPRALA